jgi:hypothetical protein
VDAAAHPQESKQTEACADVILLGLYLLAAFHLRRRLCARNARTIQPHTRIYIYTLSGEPSGELFRLLPATPKRNYVFSPHTTFAIFLRREPRELKIGVLCVGRKNGRRVQQSPLKLGLLLELRCEEPFCARCLKEKGALERPSKLIDIGLKVRQRIVPPEGPFYKSTSTCLLLELVWANILKIHS